MRRIALLIVILSGLCCGVAGAEEFSLPGLAQDSDGYAAQLSKRYPAGGTTQARRQAEQEADAAIRRSDYGAAASALERRIGLGDTDARIWMALAEAEMHRTPPDATHALEAAWQAFDQLDTGPEQVPSLLLMADALRTLNRSAQAIQALEAASERAPNDANVSQALTDVRRWVGMLVRQVHPEPDADPPRACIAFTSPPSRGADFHPQDWVALQPRVPGAAVTQENDQICVSGLPSGATTSITLRAGMPGEDGLSLVKSATLSVAIANRQPRIDFDTRMFLLPHGQTPTLSMSTVNLSAVKLTLARLSERNIVAFLHENRLGQPVETWAANQIAEQTGRVVWQGTAAVPKWVPNRTAHTALPLPDVVASAGPGLYALSAEAGDGTPNVTGAVQMFLRTDLAPTIWRGADGLTVQVRSYSDVKPRPGVRLRLVAANNDILAETTTDPDGVGRFAAPLLHGDGPVAPRALEALGPNEDFTTLDLDSAAFNLADRGVSGMPAPGPLDAFVWLDRGIYRPGETVQVMALLRDDVGQPVDLPAHVTIRRPNGQVYLETTPARGAQDSLYVPVRLTNSAPAGTWSVEVRADPTAPPIGRTEFRVDAFVPDRMAVDLGPAQGPIVPGRPFTLPVTARFLYGAPASGLTGKATLHLLIDEAPFPILDGYHVGLQDEVYAPDAKEADLAETDPQGHTSYVISIPRPPDTSFALKAAVDVVVNDPSGHGSRAQTEIKLRPSGPLLGIKPMFKGGAIDAGTEAGFDVIAVDPDGKRIGMPVRLRLVRERPDWRLVMHGTLARYETVWRDEPLQTQNVTIPPDATLHFAQKLDFGRYRIEVLQANGGLAASSLHFRAGWVSSDTPDVPDQVDVSADRASYPPGAMARIHIAPPFAGEATLLALGDRVHLLRTLSVPAGGSDVEVPVSDSWGPGAYLTVHVFRPAVDARDRPARAIGLVWLGIDPAARKLNVTFDTPEKLAPRTRARIPIHTAPGAWVSLAVVDEGILRLTNFPTPDPASHYLGRRMLGIDIRDDWGHLIAPGEGEATALRQGGDEGSFVLPDIPLRTVTLFVPPQQAGPDGALNFMIDLPDFAGQVRLMAVGWQGNSIGAGAVDARVVDPLVAEPLLPRFLAPGDQARLTVLLQNLDLPAGEDVAKVSVDGPLALSGETRLAVALAAGAQATPFTLLTATGAGRGVVKLDVTGPGGFAVHREAFITIRPARGATSTVTADELRPGASVNLDPATAAYVPGTWHAVATFGGPVQYNIAGLVAALEQYPLNCIEQATSRGLPLALLPDGPLAGPDRAGRLQNAVSFVLDRQRYDGGFGLWSAEGEAEPWLSSYATEFLLRARDAGAAIPPTVLRDAIKFEAEAADSAGDNPEDLANQAYRLYVLGLAGQGRPGAARVLAAQMDRLPTPLARAQLGAALALAHDIDHARGAFIAALATPTRAWWRADYGTALRDQVATAVLLKESGVAPDLLARLVGSMPGANLDPDTLSTQEQAWAAAAGAVLGHGGRPAHITLDGKELAIGPVVTAALSGPVTARNQGDQAVWRSVSVTGVPVTASPAARAGMRISRQFLNLDGTPLDLDHLKQNTVFVLLLEGKAEDGQTHQAMVQHGLPAGWELAGRFSGGDATPGLPWLGKLSEPEAQPAADDRYAAVVELTPEQPTFRLAVRLRAVTPGTFELPGAEAADMYRPGVFARQTGGRITVQGVE
jgi:alpha-2-macroglobulin